MAQQPINYTIEEVEGLLDPANKVSLTISLPWTLHPHTLSNLNFPGRRCSIGTVAQQQQVDCLS